LCLDANDPQHLAHFWAAALGWELGDSDGEVALLPTDDTRFGILFESRSGEVRPSLRLATASSSSRLGSLKPTLLGLKSLCGFQRRRAAYSVANPAHFLSVRSVGFYASRKPSTSGFRSHGGTKRETLSGRFQAAFPWGLRQWCSIPLSRVVTA
jgi:hypothetical protein